MPAIRRYSQMLNRSSRGSVLEPTRLIALAIAAFSLMTAARAAATNQITVLDVNLDPPTPTTLGVQLLIDGDDNRDAEVFVKYRPQASGIWRDGLPLVRVNTTGVASSAAVPEQFAGSIFNLEPATAYDIELTVKDEDNQGPVTLVRSQTTRALPPATAPCTTTYTVSTSAAFRSRLNNAVKGDCIVLSAGTYNLIDGDSFELEKSGTSTEPIIVKGTVIGGVNQSVINADCPNFECSVDITGCNGLVIGGQHVIIEDIAFTNAKYAVNLRRSNDVVIRRISTSNVCGGIFANSNSDFGPQTNFYVCDNDLVGPINPAWPRIYTDLPRGAYDSTIGVQLPGTGHVICHNRIRGFGDGIRFVEYPQKLRATRAIDIYGNDIQTGYDNSIELDYTQGNIRAFRNRLLNSYAPLSFQPVYGGPAYAFRNVVVNITREQLKISTRGAEGDPSGIRVFHNTFVNNTLFRTDTNNQTHLTAASVKLINDNGETVHNLLVENNIFFGRASTGLPSVDFDVVLDGGLFDYNGYAPNGLFTFEQGGEEYQSFDELQQDTLSKFERHGRLLPPTVFASGLQPPSSYQTEVTNPNVTLADNALVDAGEVLPNINDGYQGNAPDLGALEKGCTLGAPSYGPRPAGVDESNNVIGCEGIPPTPWSLCSAMPATGCKKAQPGGTRFEAVHRSRGINARQLKFQWKHGSSAPATFGDPTTDATYYLCVYDTDVTTSARRLVSETVIPAGGTNCGPPNGSTSCWQSKSAGGTPSKWTYRNNSRTGPGTTTLVLAADGYSTRGAYIQLKMRGRFANLPGNVEFSAPVTVQLRNTQTSTCWDVDFTANEIKTRPGRFGAIERP